MLAHMMPLLLIVTHWHEALSTATLNDYNHKTK